MSLWDDSRSSTRVYLFWQAGVLLLFSALLLFVWSCSSQDERSGQEKGEYGSGTGPQEEGFCGRSTGFPCNDDSDCAAGGCSGQVCAGASEGPIATTCEYRECYNALKYGLSCRCSSGECRWS